jgi:hypothetical protein
VAAKAAKDTQGKTANLVAAVKGLPQAIAQTKAWGGAVKPPAN